MDVVVRPNGGIGTDVHIRNHIAFFYSVPFGHRNEIKVELVIPRVHHWLNTIRHGHGLAIRGSKVQANAIAVMCFLRIDDFIIGVNI